MASGNGTSDGLRREEHSRTKCLGKATQENKTSTALESLSGPEKNQIPKIPSTQQGIQDLTSLSEGKQAVQVFEFGHDTIDPNKQSSTSSTIESFQDGHDNFPSSNEERITALGSLSSSKKKLIQALQETDSQINGPNPAQSNLERVAASAAPTGATAVEPNVGSVVALLGQASSEPNGGALVLLNDAGHAEPIGRPIVVLHGAAPAQSNVAPPGGEVLAQPNFAPNYTPPAPAVVASNVVPHRGAPLQPDFAAHAQRHGVPPAPVQQNAALIVAPPVIVVLDVNRGLNRSRLKPLRICEIGSEGHFWPKLP